MRLGRVAMCQRHRHASLSVRGRSSPSIRRKASFDTFDTYVSSTSSRGGAEGRGQGRVVGYKYMCVT